MKRFKRWVIGCVVLLLIGAAALCISFSIFPVKSGDLGRSITVMTYNTHCFGWLEPQKRKEMLKYIGREDADVVCLQEVNLYTTQPYLTMGELRHAMRKYAYTYYDFKVWGHGKQFGNVVFSRYPLIHKQTIPYSSRSNISSRCDMVVGEDTLQLVVNHLESFHFNPTDLSVDSLTSQPIHQTSLHRKWKDGTKRRRAQAAAVRKAVSQSPYRAIVVGDFNSIPVSYVYLKIRGWMKDAFLTTSRGKWGATYRLHGVGVRIDYILCSRSLQPVDCRVGEACLSDHRPVIATIAIP